MIKLQNQPSTQNCLPARTAVPIQESTPDRNELKGNDPTIPMYTTYQSDKREDITIWMKRNMII